MKTVTSFLRTFGSAAIALAVLAAFGGVAASPLRGDSETTEIREADLAPPRGDGADRLATGDLPEPAAAALEAARRRKDDVQSFLGRFQKKLKQVDESLGGLDLRRSVEAQALAKEHALRLLDELDEEARVISDAYVSVQSDLQLFRQALAKTPAAFQEVAAQFRKLAEGETDEFLKEQYLDFADTAGKLATRYHEDGQKLRETERDLAAKMVFVAKSQTFNKHLRAYLDILPQAEGAEVERFVKRLNDYLKAHQEAIRAIRGIGERIGEPKPTADPSASPKPMPQASEGKPSFGTAA